MNSITITIPQNINWDAIEAKAPSWFRREQAYVFLNLFFGGNAKRASCRDPREWLSLRQEFVRRLNRNATGYLTVLREAGVIEAKTNVFGNDSYQASYTVVESGKHVKGFCKQFRITDAYNTKPMVRMVVTCKRVIAGFLNFIVNALGKTAGKAIKQTKTREDLKAGSERVLTNLKSRVLATMRRSVRHNTSNQLDSNSDRNTDSRITNTHIIPQPLSSSPSISTHYVAHLDDRGSFDDQFNALFGPPSDD